MSLGLAGVVRREFPVPRGRLAGPEPERYFADLTEGFGVPCRPGLPLAGTSYVDMARELAAELRRRPFDLVVLVNSVPDLDPWRSAATYLNDALPGRPLLFAISDQGRSAVFTALRAVLAYARRHDHGRALVLAMDRSALPYPAPAPRGDAIAALILERDAGELSVHRLPEVTPDRVPEVLAGYLAPGMALVAGAGIGEVPAHSGPIRRVPPGLPCAGIWSTPPKRATVFADYDRDRRELSLCVTKELVRHQGRPHPYHGPGAHLKGRAR